MGWICLSGSSLLGWETVIKHTQTHTRVFTHTNQGGMDKDIHYSVKSCKQLSVHQQGMGLHKLWHIYTLEYHASKKEQNDSKHTNKKTLHKLFPEKAATI